jgi:hypothetical protein
MPVICAFSGSIMRQSNLKTVCAHFTRGALVISAISVVSLHAAAQSSDVAPTLPNPIFAVTPGIANPGMAPALPQLGGVSSGMTAAIASQPVVTPSAPMAAVPVASNPDGKATDAKPTDAKPTDDSLTPATVLPSAVVPAIAPSAPAAAPAQTASRMTGFAAPTSTTDVMAKPEPAAAAPVAAAPVITPAKVTSASSRAGIPRLNRQVAAPIAPHPLTAAYPGYDVIVCIAGCGPQPTAVSVYKPKPTKPAAQGGIIQVAMNSGSPDNASECVAGCYDDAPAPRSRANAAATAPAAVTSPGSPAGATDRSVMVQTSASPAKPIPTPKAKAATPAKATAKKPAGSEWFTRRFEKPATN